MCEWNGYGLVIWLMICKFFMGGVLFIPCVVLLCTLKIKMFDSLCFVTIFGIPLVNEWLRHGRETCSGAICVVLSFFFVECNLLNCWVMNKNWDEWWTLVQCGSE